MNKKEELLKRCNQNFDETTQKFGTIDDYVLDLIYETMSNGLKLDNESEDDFVDFFIYDVIGDLLKTKIGTIIKCYLMNCFDEYVADAKENIFG